MEKLAFVQHILLGMNAHINLDLAVAASIVSPGNAIIKLKSDFMIVNQILAELTNKIQKRLGRVSFFTEGYIYNYVIDLQIDVLY
jgi:hypothetical protein